MPSSIAVLGWYGRGNTGNRLIAEGIRRCCADVLDRDCSFLAVSRPEKAIVVDEYVDREIDLLTSGGRAELELHDVVILGGGLLTTLLRELWTDPKELAASLARVRTPMLIWGVGSGESSQPSRRFADLDPADVDAVMTRFTSVTVRDRLTARLLRLPEHAVIPDPAFYLDGVSAATSDRPRLLVVPTARPWLSDRTEAWSRLIAESLRRRFTVGVIAFQATDGADFNDARLARTLASKFPQGVVSVVSAPSLRIPDLLEEFGAARCVVSARLHGVIAGLVAGTATAAIQCDPKIAPTLDAAGFPRRGVTFESFTGLWPDLACAALIRSRELARWHQSALRSSLRAVTADLL